MAEKRKKSASFCFKSGASRIKVELFDATEWNGESGLCRVRINGCWADSIVGVRGYFSAAEVGTLLASYLSSLNAASLGVPTLQKGTRVSVPNGRRFAGCELRDCTFVVTKTPLRDTFCQWFVGVVRLTGGGIRLVPVEDVQVLLGAEFI